MLTIDEETIATIHYLEKLTDIDEKIYNSSNYATNIIAEKKIPTYYMFRTQVVFKDDIAEKYNLNKVFVDVILDDKMNVLNKLNQAVSE